MGLLVGCAWGLGSIFVKIESEIFIPGNSDLDTLSDKFVF